VLAGDNRGVNLPFLNLSIRLGWVVNTMPWPLYSWERVLLPIVQLHFYRSLNFLLLKKGMASVVLNILPLSFCLYSV
jgi:hypothetical protein